MPAAASAPSVGISGQCRGCASEVQPKQPFGRSGQDHRLRVGDTLDQRPDNRSHPRGVAESMPGDVHGDACHGSCVSD
jgi:hypothetical protein